MILLALTWTFAMSWLLRPKLSLKFLPVLQPPYVCTCTFCCFPCFISQLKVEEVRHPCTATPDLITSSVSLHPLQLLTAVEPTSSIDRELTSEVVIMMALFSSRKFLVLATVALSFVCDNYYPIIE